MQPHILDRETVYDGYLNIERLKVQLTDGTVAWREVERHGSAAAVLPYDVNRRCALLVRQFRAPIFASSGRLNVEEACAGMIDNETAEDTARREAKEELGVTLHALELVGQVWSSPGVSTERLSLFLAPYTASDRHSDGGGAPGEHEGITVIERPLEQLRSAVDEQRIDDVKLLSLILALRIRQPGLF